MAEPQPYVFVASSSRDAEIVKTLVVAIQQSGIDVRFDDDIEVGESWGTRLQEMQSGARATLVVWSRSAAESSNVVRQATLAQANASIIPATLEGVDCIPDAFRTVRAFDLAPWLESNDSAVLEPLISAIRRRISADGAADGSAGSTTDSPSMSIRPGANELLVLAEEIADRQGVADPKADDLLLAVLCRPLVTNLDVSELRNGATYMVYEAIPERRDDRLRAALTDRGIDPEALKDKLRRDGRVTSLLEQAVGLARAVKATELWSHHVAAVALGDASIPADFLAELGVDVPRLRALLRRAIANDYPDESSVAWNRHLGPLAPDDGSDEAAVESQSEPKVARDYWTVDDHLGTRTYADAIASFILHRDTEPPLTIGIKAPWGAGKTSLMRMVQAKLDPPTNPGAARWEFQKIQMTSAGFRQLASGGKTSGGSAPPEHRESINTALRRTRSAPVEPPNLGVVKSSKLAGTDDRDDEIQKTWRPTVWFNPWMYQRGEEVWAGFAHEIIEQVTGRLPVRERERFWLELNLRRLDRQAVRRRLYRVMLERLLPVLLGWLLVSIAAIVAFAGTSWMNWLGGGGVLAFAGAAVAGRVIVGRQHVGDAAAALVRPPNLSPVADGLRGALEGATAELFPDPGYQSKAGFLYFVQNDMRHVLDLVATNRCPLVILVDDLDRCSPGVVAQTIEAINLFLAGEFPNVIFLLAIEPAVVAAHVEVAHKDLVERMKNDRFSLNWSTLGWRFLEKIVQLPLTVPRPSPQQATDYLSSLLGGPSADETASTHDREQRAEDLARTGPAPPEQSSLDNLPAWVDDLERTMPEGLDDALRADARARFVTNFLIEHSSDADPVVQEIVQRQALQLSGHNPREVKRLINLFRFYSFVAAHNRALDSSTSESLRVTLERVARLAVMAIRWPYLLSAMARPDEHFTGDVSDSERPPILLERLERVAKDKAEWEKVLLDTHLAVAEGQPPALCAEGWIEEFRDFCQLEPKIGSLARAFL